MKQYVAIVFFAFSPIIYADCPSVSEDIEKIITKHTQNVKGGEYCNDRVVFNQKKIELAIYTILGPCYKTDSSPGSCGNHYFTSIVGIIEGKEFKSIVIGGKGVFHPSTISYTDGMIIVNGLSYKKTDPLCCPTINSQRKYKIGDSEFVHINP